MSNTMNTATISNILRAAERFEGLETGSLKFRMALDSEGVEIQVNDGDGFNESVRGANQREAEQALGALWYAQAEAAVKEAEQALAAAREVVSALKGRAAPAPGSAKPGRKPGVPSLTEQRSTVTGMAARAAREQRGLSRDKAGAALSPAVTGATIANWEAGDKPVPVAYATLLGLMPQVAESDASEQVSDEPAVMVVEG